MHRIIDPRKRVCYVSDRLQLPFPDFFYTEHYRIILPVPMWDFCTGRMQFCKNPFLLNNRPLSREFITTLFLVCLTLKVKYLPFKIDIQIRIPI